MKQGERFSKEIQITKGMIKDFVELIGDPNPIHQDRKAAKERESPDIVAPGMLLACLEIIPKV